MNILFTVCGRAGSKGVKNKNLKCLLGKPLVYYTMAAIELYIENFREFDIIHYCLNTDSKDLVNLVLNWNPDYYIINRTSHLAEDDVPNIAVITDCLTKADEYYKIDHDIVIDLDITSPLRTIQDIFNTVKKKKEDKTLDIVFSVTGARRNPFFNQVKENDDGTVSKVITSQYTARQQTPKIFDMNASIYVYESQFLKNNSSNMIFDGKCGIVEMYDSAVLDIDSEEDFLLMEVIAEYLFRNKLDYNKINNKIILS
jgi:CMP-N,N'-diacetyllegionaminic acid synthase